MARFNDYGAMDPRYWTYEAPGEDDERNERRLRRKLNQPKNMANEDEKITPGRYATERPLSVGVVLATVDGRGYGYMEHDGVAGLSLEWNLNGVFGDGSHPSMNLLSRIKEVAE